MNDLNVLVERLRRCVLLVWFLRYDGREDLAHVDLYMIIVLLISIYGSILNVLLLINTDSLPFRPLWNIGLVLKIMILIDCFAVSSSVAVRMLTILY